MTGRYARRSVPLTVRGIATEKYFGHPLPETIREHESDEVDRLSDSRTDSIAERYSTRASSVQNSVAQLVNDEPNIYNRFTGSATERSSIYSFGDDEFDRQSSLNVQKLFDELELILFERSTVGSAHLRNECSVWMSEFPHLRVVGTVKFPQQDLGFKFVEHKEDLNLTPRNAEDSGTGRELVVKGKRVSIEKYSSRELSTSLENRDDFGSCLPGGVEEVITQEGLVEEILAIDSRPGEHGNDYLKRDVLQNLFSELWPDVVNGLEEVLGRSTRHPHHYQMFGVKNTAPSVSDLFHNTQEPVNHDMFLTRESTSVSTIRPNAFDKTSRRLSIGDQKLAEVLKISSKTLQTRDKIFNHDSSFDVDFTRPNSGFLPISGRHYNSRFNDQVTSARSKNAGGRGRLVPITANDSLKAFIIDDETKHLDLAHEVIRGYKMTTSNDRFALLPSSSISIAQPSGPLPPIARDTSSLSSVNSNNNSVFRKKGMLRVRSALPNKALHVQEQVAEKVWPPSDYMRPHRAINTLYTIDHPQLFGNSQRSSTTLGFSIIGVNQTQSIETGASGIGKNQRKLSLLGNRIPEYEEDVDDDCVSEATQLSTKITDKRFLHNNVLRHSGEGFGRRAGQPHQRVNTAIR